MSTSLQIRRRDAITRWAMAGFYIGNLFLITSVWFTNQKLLNSLGTDLTAIGGLAGLIGAYLILVQIALMSRLDWLEAAFGRDKLANFHRLNGYAALIALLSHAIFLTLGYAVTYRVDVVSQFVAFATDFADVLKSIVALIMFIVIVGLSVWVLRKRLPYELWYGIHFLAYLAVALAFGHQLAVGVDFVNNPLFVDYWYLLYALTFGFLIIYRFATPLFRSWRHRLVVHSVVRENSETISIYITGRDLDKVRFRAGQFASWYFLGSSSWWQSHPFSFSEGYNGKYLRITVKDLGNYTHELDRLKAGSWVIMDGPHGRFVSDLRQRDKVLLVGGGVGITPLRSMLRELAPKGVDVVLVYGTRTREHIGFEKELKQFATLPNVRVEYVLSGVPGRPQRYIDREAINELVPDILEREVYVCGPVVMMNSVTESILQMGLSKRLIHSERFSY